MNKIAEALQSIAVTLWVGSLWTIGLIVAPVLFHELGDRARAGMLAGRFFTLIAYAGLACGAYLVLFRLARFGGLAFRQSFFWVLLLMIALVCAGQFGVQPILASLKEQALPKEVMESLFRNRFAAWHGVSSGLYLLECALGLVLVLKQSRA
jgi:hypothetical protein